MTKISFLKQITSELSLHQYNEIPVLKLEHNVGNALISLQGAQLLSWQPKSQQKDTLWLSEVEPFTLGNAIRGGVPICYPWFGSIKSPAHGYARNAMWKLNHHHIEDQKVRLEFCLYSDKNMIEAKLEMEFTQDCKLTFTHYGDEPAQVALHSYFNISSIENIEIKGLPTSTFNALTQKQEIVSSPRKINENVDCIYNIPSLVTHYVMDPDYHRRIKIIHQNATDTVVWNPWHKKMSGMSETGYKTMVCVETACISQKITKGDQVSTIIRAINQ